MIFSSWTKSMTLVCVLVAASARAQSAELLDAIRVHQPDAAFRAERELAATTVNDDKQRLMLLTAFLELSGGQPKTALKRLESSRPPPALRAFHRWYWAEAAAWAGQPKIAAKILESLRPSAPPSLKQRVERRLAELYLILGRPAQAHAVLERDVEVEQNPELLLTRAVAFEQTGNAPRAEADWKRLAISFPAHPHGAEAWQRLSKNKERWTFAEQLSRAQALLAGQSPQECLLALENLGQATSENKDTRAQVALLSGQALFALGPGHDAEAEKQLRIAAEESTPTAAEALLSLAKRKLRGDQHDEARTLLQRVDKQYPAIDEAGYLAAWLAMKGGQYAQAATEFENFEARHPTSRRRDEARWFRGLSWLKVGQHSKAREVWASLRRDFPASSLVPQAQYWVTRAAQLSSASVADAGEVSNVISEYTVVAKEFPGSLYALLAEERLKELGAAPPPAFAQPPRRLTVPQPGALKLAAELARTGLFNDASLEVKQAIRNLTAHDALTWGHALTAMGDFGTAHALAARFLWGEVYTKQKPEAVALMYPQAYKQSVETWARQHAVEPALAWAIMRRESAFSPDVTSTAQARGLMQLMAETGSAVARALNVPAGDAAQLYSPDWNIRLGTWYLHALSERLHHPTLVAAAYNAGPSSVVRWAEARRDIPLDLWIEEIPLKETRGYVKQVTADLFLYRKLYGGSTESLPLEIPAPGTGINF